MYTKLGIDVGPEAGVHEQVAALYPTAKGLVLQYMASEARCVLALHGVPHMNLLSAEDFDDMVERLGDVFTASSTTVTPAENNEAAESQDDRMSQAPTDEIVKPTSETHIRASEALAKLKQTKLVRKKVAKLGGCTAEESVILKNLRLDPTMENRIQLEVWKDKVKDQASLGRVEDDLVHIFAAMAGNTIDDDDDLEAERRRLMKEAHRFA